MNAGFLLYLNRLFDLMGLIICSVVTARSEKEENQLELPTWLICKHASTDAAVMNEFIDLCLFKNPKAVLLSLAARQHDAKAEGTASQAMHVACPACICFCRGL